MPSDEHRLYHLKRFQDGYFYPTPMTWGEWLVMSSLAVMAGMKAAHIGLNWYLNTFDYE